MVVPQILVRRNFDQALDAVVLAGSLREIAWCGLVVHAPG
jgi:hypothetical protein